MFIYLIFPILLTAQVDTAWVRRYNGPANHADNSWALAIDDSGYVYVTGESSNGGGTDFVTIKYCPNGDTAWLRRYNGGIYDEAHFIAVDTSGDVYVTGASGVISNYNYTTIKYYPDGDTAWVRMFDDLMDWPTDMKIDNSGNVYVTGETGPSIDFDYLTIKYFPNGDTAWVRRYSGDTADFACAIAVDASGNVYVSGTSAQLGRHHDYLTIKYHPNGDTAWVRRFNGSADSDDDAWAMAVDGSGNVYVTGCSDISGLSGDYMTVKYNTNGDTVWARAYDGPGHNGDIPEAITVDDLDNVYVTGTTNRTGGFDMDYATIKYFPNGDTAWVRFYSGRPGDYSDGAHALAVDYLGNVYVTGGSSGYDESFDYATIKYFPNGVEAWVRRYAGPAGGNDGAFDLTVDSMGNVYVTGKSPGFGSDFDYLTIKYAPTQKIGEDNIGRFSSDKKPVVFPNPAHEYFTVCLPTGLGRFVITLYDITGKKINEVECNSGELEKRIFLTDISPGIFFVEINGKLEQKVIKVR